MGSLSKLIKEKGGELGRGKAEQVKVQQIHYTKLKESELNFYTRSEDEVTELADTMLIAGGILQPLIVRKIDLSEYEILAGHKRKRASVYNVERGYKEYEFLPCIVIDMSGLMAKKISEKILTENGEVEDDKLLDMIAEYIVICTNSTTSESSDYEKMMQAVRLSKILPVMLDNEELKGRALRAEIAKEMKYGDGQIGRYLSMYNNLVPEAMERFKDGTIKFSVACSLSGFDKEQQLEVLKKQQITTADIEALKQDKNTEAVSKLDTKKVVSTESEDAIETVSKLDTDSMSPTTAESLYDGYEKIEDTKENIYHVLELIFDDEKSGFPPEVIEELSNALDNTGGNVSLMTDIFDKALPFENGYIRIERIFGYSICCEGKKMTVALWPFWSCFIGKYRYNESLSPSGEMAAGKDEDIRQNTENDGIENVPIAVLDQNIQKTAATKDTNTIKVYSIDYTLEDVNRIYNEQAERLSHIKGLARCGELTESDKWQQKKAKIIQDGMTRILEAFREGTIC